MYINISVQYLRPKQVPYVRDTLQAIVRELVEASDLDLESEPSKVCVALFLPVTNSQLNFRFIGRGLTLRKCDLVEPVQSLKNCLSTKLSRIQIPELSTLDVRKVFRILINYSRNNAI